jgi:predicted PurR-regulated permease PerM
MYGTVHRTGTGTHRASRVIPLLETPLDNARPRPNTSSLRTNDWVVPGRWVRALMLPLIVLSWLAVLMIAGWLLGHVARTVLLVALSGIIAFALTPLASYLARWTPRPVALAAAYVVGVGAFFGILVYVVATTASQVTALVGDLPAYAAQLQKLEPQVATLGLPAESVANIQQRIFEQSQATGTTVARESLSWLAGLLSGMVDLVLVIIVSAYLAANGARIAHWLKTETPPGSTRYRAHLLVAVVSRVIGGYIRGVLVLALLTGVLVGAGMAVLGMPYPVMLGVLAFFMEFVPVLGVIISGAASVGIALVYFQEPIRPLLVLGYFIFVHIIEGDVIGPRIMGKAVGIHPATGLIALVAGTELFGVWGALFAAPVAGLLQAILTAAWIEFRGGPPQEVLEAVAAESAETMSRELRAS